MFRLAFLLVGITSFVSSWQNSLPEFRYANAQEPCKRRTFSATLVRNDNQAFTTNRFNFIGFKIKQSVVVPVPDRYT
jgi:hypothetical protein